MGRRWGMKTAWAKSFFVPEDSSVAGTSTSTEGAADLVSRKRHRENGRMTPAVFWSCTRCGCALTVPIDAHTGRPSYVILAEHLEGISLSGSAPLTGVVPCTAGTLRYVAENENNSSSSISTRAEAVGEKEKAVMDALRQMFFGVNPLDSCSGVTKTAQRRAEVKVFIAVENPKTPANLGGILRAIGCFGASGLIFSGSRLLEALKHRPVTDTQAAGVDVPHLCIADIADIFPLLEEATGETGLFEYVVVAVDLIHDATPLPLFNHPLLRDTGTGSTTESHARPLGKVVIYLFGAEDGSIRQELLDRCHAAVFIPTRGSLNLAATVNAVLYDRCAAEWRLMAASEGNEGVVHSAAAEAAAASLRSRNKNNRTSWGARSLPALRS